MFEEIKYFTNLNVYKHLANGKLIPVVGTSESERKILCVIKILENITINHDLSKSQKLEKPLKLSNTLNISTFMNVDWGENFPLGLLCVLRNFCGDEAKSNVDRQLKKQVLNISEKWTFHWFFSLFFGGLQHDICDIVVLLKFWV